MPVELCLRIKEVFENLGREISPYFQILERKLGGAGDVFQVLRRNPEADLHNKSYRELQSQHPEGEQNTNDFPYRGCAVETCFPRGAGY